MKSAPNQVSEKEISRGYIYKDDFFSLKFLSDEQKGVLLEAICKFMFYHEEIEISDKTVVVAFAPIRNHIQRDQEAYRAICEKNSANSRERKNIKRQEIATRECQIREPAKVLDRRWVAQTIGGIPISAEELQRANNFFFWKNYPYSQLKACFDYYGLRNGGWGQWTTPEARWNFAVGKWTNRTGLKRFPDDILLMVGEIFDIAPDDMKNEITSKEFNVKVIDDGGVQFICGRDYLARWLKENAPQIEKITGGFGYGRISLALASENGR